MFPRDTEALRTLLGHHGLFLKQHRVRLPEEVAEMFEQLLAPGEEGQDSQVGTDTGEHVQSSIPKPAPEEQPSSEVVEHLTEKP